MSVVVDGHELAADPRQNLLEVCLSRGLDLPYFCWHPALGSVGACRQCAVKQFQDEHDEHGRLVMACMTAAGEGTRIALHDAEAVAFRASVIEWLMTNHPHDCPVCEEGGECHLQDMTLMSGHVYRRYRFRKRTHRNQYLGPFVKHEMNRCIACYRCVRFYRDYAGGRDLDVFGAHNHVYFGRHADGILESEFSGNLVEVCPTGVFTDKTLSAVYTRKWDLQSAPSICVHCGLGCNTFVNGRYGELRRVINRYHHQINGYFLCDRGRFGHAFVQQQTRLRRPLHAPPGSPAQPIDGAHALALLAGVLREGAAARTAAGRSTVIGIGSPRASLEANFALRSLVGAEHFYQGVADAEAQLLRRVVELLRAAPAQIATLQEAEAADAALVLGADVADGAPRLALALRQMTRQASFALATRQKVPVWQDAAVRDLARDARTPLFIASTDATRLDDVAITFRLAPADITRLGYAVLDALDASTPPRGPARATAATAIAAAAAQIAQALRTAERPLIVASVADADEALLWVVADLAAALRRAGHAARLLLTVPECNSIGLGLLGGAPLSGALEALRAGRVHTVLILENDLYRRAEHAAVAAALEAARHVVVIDHTAHATARRAELILPAATFAESSGTLINCEGRAQRFFQLLSPPDEVAASWRWLSRATGALDAAAPRWDTLDQLLEAIASELPALAAIRTAAPSAELRIAGSRIASAPHRQSGRTALHADRSVHEPPPEPYPDGPFTNSMEGYYGAMPAAVYPYFWAPAWNSEQGLNKFQQEVGGPLRGGPAGVRLLGTEPTLAAAPDTATGSQAVARAAIPAPFAPRQGQWLLIPRQRVFGSDELSAYAPAVAERIPPATLALNPGDATQLGVGEGDRIDIELPGGVHTLPVELQPALVRGVAAMSVGLPGQPWWSLPAWVRLSRRAA